MDEALALNTKAHAVRIGIRGLTQTKSMLCGGIYLLIAETTSARFPMLAGSVAGAFEDGLVCTLIVPGNTAQFIQRIERLARINTADLVANGRLQIFMIQDNFLTKIFQYGAERFVEELEDFGIAENSYLIFDQADELLSLHDVTLAQEQINVLKEWFSRKGITALLVFSRFTEAHNNTVNAIMDSLGGIVRLGGAREGLELKFDYWQSPTAVIAAKNYQLETLDTGLYKATTKLVASDPVFDDEIQEENSAGRQMLGYENGVHYAAKPVVDHIERYRGYLKPLAFMQEVNRILDRLNGSDMSGALIVGAPVKGMQMSDIVRRFDRSSRMGELITADDRQCYIYLNIDAESVVLDSVEILLGRPVDVVFDQYRLLNSLEEIRLELSALSYAVQLRTCPDFSSIHEIPLPPQIATSPRVNEGVTLLASKNRLVSSVSLPSSEEVKKKKFVINSEKSVEIDFELAKRSVSLHPNFLGKDASTGEGVANVTSEPDDVLFDFDIELENPVFEKNEAPRAKRTFN